MAILTFAAPVSGLRGKVGGTVYSANKSGPYLKAWARGSNPRSADQTNHRAKLVQFAQAWAALSTSDQTNWNNYAALAPQEKTNSLGEAYYTSGFNWFCEINLNLASAGQAQRDTFPTEPVPPAPDDQNFRVYKTGGSSNTRWFLTVTSPQQTDFHVVKAQIVNGTGVTAFAPVRPFMTSLVPVSRTIAFQTELENRFGEIQEGQRVYSTIAIQNAHGRRGPSEARDNEALP